nr:hypothetical protein [Candidatus Angelobacter sp.]
MKLYLQSIDYSLWFLAGALHAVLGVLLVARGVWKRLPFFSAQVYVCLASNVACYVIAQNGTLANYAYTNFGGTLIVDALLAGFLWREVYLTTFGPRVSLPEGVPVRVFLYVAALYAAVIVTGSLLPDVWLRSAFPAMTVAARWLLGALAAASIVLLVYSFRLGISWRRHTLILASGLAFTTVGELAASYLYSFVSPAGAAILRQSSTAAYLVTLVLWIWGVACVRKPEVITQEMLRTLKDEFTDITRLAPALLGEGHTEPTRGHS